MNPDNRTVLIAETKAACSAEFEFFLINPGAYAWTRLEKRMRKYQESVCSIRDDDTLLRGEVKE